MIQHYWKIAFRNLWKNRAFTLINITGLTTGLACCILIGLFIADETSYDRFHSNKDRIVRTTMEYSSSNSVQTSANTGTRVGPRLKATFPAIDAFVRTMKSSASVSYNNQQFAEKNILYADSAFFTMFSFPLLQGDARTALNGNDKVIVTASAAGRYFGTENPVGKTIRIGQDKNYTVSAVAKDVPSNSQIQFDFVINFTGLEAAKREEWWTANYITYFLLKDYTDITALEKQVTQYMTTPQVKQEARLEGSRYLLYHFEPLTRVHLYSDLDGFEPNGNITYIYILAAIALLILIIACVNYTNLAIAQSVNRGSEIGIRKVLGALRKQLFFQFIGESTLITFSSLLLAIIASSQLLPVMNEITTKQLGMGTLFAPVTLAVLFAAAILLSFIAGAYPALILSGSAITSILKKGTGLLRSGAALRKSLIVVQFVISVFLISTTLVIRQQMRYIQQRELGYDREHVLIMPISYRQLAAYDGLKDAIKRLPGVQQVSGGYGLPTSVQWSDGISVDNSTGTQDLPVKAMPVDQDFIATMNMQLVAGADFTRSDLALMDTSSDRKNFRYTYMLNETAVKSLGWTPEQAIGKTIHGNADGTVKAVVKDFHFASMREAISPLVVFMDKSLVRNIFIRFQSDNISSLITGIGDIWKERMPGTAFSYRFVDEDFNRLYRTEHRTAAIFSISASLAIFLACLGLFGLAAFTAAQRTKEIGIRKVLGAGLVDITALLSKDFLVLVACSLLIATPLAWLATGRWLSDFAYRIQPGWLVYAVAGVSVTLLAMVTAGFHAVRVAMLNPVKSLRSE